MRPAATSYPKRDGYSAAVPLRWGPFLLGGPLAESMSEVFWGEVAETGVPVAVKLPHRTMLRGDAGAWEAHAKAIAREAEIGADVGGDRVLQVVAHGNVHGVPYVATRLVPGCTLRQLLEAAAQGTVSLSMAQRLALLGGLAESLANLHRQGWVHRDLKPSNVYLREDGTVLLMDLGVSGRPRREVGSTTTLMAFRSQGYTSPEALLDGEVGRASDVFVYGVLWFEVLTGRSLWRGRGSIEAQVVMVQQALPQEAVEAVEAVRAGASAVLRGSLCVLHDRWPDGAALLTAVQPLLVSGEEVLKTVFEEAPELARASRARLQHAKPVAPTSTPSQRVGASARLAQTRAKPPVAPTVRRSEATPSPFADEALRHGVVLTAGMLVFAGGGAAVYAVWPSAVVVAVSSMLVLLQAFNLAAAVVAAFLGVSTVVVSVGAGPRVLGWAWRGTDYRLSALPLGGYVQWKGSDWEVEHDLAGSFRAQPWWARGILCLSGPVSPAVLAALASGPSATADAMRWMAGAALGRLGSWVGITEAVSWTWAETAALPPVELFLFIAVSLTLANLLLVVPQLIGVLAEGLGWRLPLEVRERVFMAWTLGMLLLILAVLLA